MRFVTCLILTALTAPLFVARAVGQPRSEAAVRAALVDFVDALDRADARALRELTWTRAGSVSQSMAADLLVVYVTGRKKLQSVAAQRFPKEADRLAVSLESSLGLGPATRPSAGRPRLVEAVRQRVAEATVTFTVDDAARVQFADEGSAVLLRPRSSLPDPSDARRWQVVLSVIETMEDAIPRDFLPPEPDRRLPGLDRLVEAVEIVTRRLREGGYATLAQAEEELARTLAAAAVNLRRRD